MKYHSLPYWSIVMPSPIEFSTSEFSTKQVRKVDPLKWHNQTRKKKKNDF